MATGCRRIWFNFIGKGRARSFRFAPHIGHYDTNWPEPESSHSFDASSDHMRDIIHRFLKHQVDKREPAASAKAVRSH